MWEEWKTKNVVVTNQRKETGKVFKTQIATVGCITAQIRLNNEIKAADFYVINGEGRLLIGRDTATTMGILKIGSSVNAIETKSDYDAKPVIQSYRRVPVQLEKLVDSG